MRTEAKGQSGGPKGSSAEECGRPLGAGKGKETGRLPKSPERTNPVNIFNVV